MTDTNLLIEFAVDIQIEHGYGRGTNATMADLRDTIVRGAMGGIDSNDPDYRASGHNCMSRLIARTDAKTYANAIKQVTTCTERFAGRYRSDRYSVVRCLVAGARVAGHQQFNRHLSAADIAELL